MWLPGIWNPEQTCPALKYDHDSPKKARAEGEGTHNANSFSFDALLSRQLARIKMQTSNWSWTWKAITAQILKDNFGTQTSSSDLPHTMLNAEEV